MNELNISGLYTPGNMWADSKSNQLRYQVEMESTTPGFEKPGPASWIQPISVYDVGNSADFNEEKQKVPTNESFVKKGQPVSIGFENDLTLKTLAAYDPCIVPTNP